MSRTQKYIKREKILDLVYKNIFVEKLITNSMYSGKKEKVSKIIYKILEDIGKKFSINPIEILTNVINKVKPDIFLRKKKVAGSLYRIPVPLDKNKGMLIAIKWITRGARLRNNNGYYNQLKSEILDIYINSKGNSIKSKDELYKTAEQNKAFTHYL